MTNPSLNFTAAIYRCTNSNDTEANVANDESIGLTVGIENDSPLAIISYDWDIPSRRTDIGAPLNKASTNPDTGVTPPTLTIGIKVNESVSDNRAVGILTKWALEDKVTRGIFTAGRFGVRNNKKPWMNFQPVKNAGYKIKEVKVDDVLEFGGMVDLVITLEFGGQTSLLVTAIETLLGEPPIGEE